MSEFILQIIGVCIILFIIGIIVYPIYKGIREQDKKSIALHATLGQYSTKLLAVKTLCVVIRNEGREPTIKDIENILKVIDLEIKKEGETNEHNDPAR